MKNKFPKKLAFLSLALSVGIILSYVEYLLPPIFAAVPGIKLGLANTVTVFLLYKQSFRSAAAVSLLRVCLISLLFASPMTLAYGLCGAVLSLLVMCLLKKTSLFSAVGVSIAGGVFHNVGQIILAIFILGTKEISYYLIPLTVSGIIAGAAVGIVSVMLVKKIDLKKFR